MQGTSQVLTTTRYLTVRQYAEAHPWPSASAIRHLIFSNRGDFRKQCVIRVGRRVLLKEAAVLDWIAAHGNAE